MSMLSVMMQAAMDFAPLAKLGAGVGAGLAAIGDIRSNMILAAALVEGVAFFAIVVCLLVIFL